MTLDTFGSLMFLAGLLAGVGITLTASTTPAFLEAAARVWRYSRQHRAWGLGYLAIVIAAELAVAAIIFTKLTLMSCEDTTSDESG